MTYNEMDYIDAPIADVDDDQLELFTVDAYGKKTPIDLNSIQEEDEQVRQVLSS